jgi:UDP-2,3-diacylglucosamine pyrophosphatase LpxH
LSEIQEKLKELRPDDQEVNDFLSSIDAEKSIDPTRVTWSTMESDPERGEDIKAYRRLYNKEIELGRKITKIEEVLNKRLGYVVVSDVHLGGNGFTPAVDSFHKLGMALGDTSISPGGRLKNPKLQNLLASMEVARKNKSTLVINGDFLSLVDMEEYFQHFYLKEIEKGKQTDFFKKFGMSAKEIKHMKVAETTEERQHYEEKFRRAIFYLIWHSYPEVEAKLKELMNEGVDVIYIAGNHDTDVYLDTRYRSMFEERFPKIKIRKSHLDDSLGLLFYHGHLSDADVSSRKAERWVIRQGIRMKRLYGPTVDFHAEEFWNVVRSGIGFLKRHVFDPVCMIQALNQWALGNEHIPTEEVTAVRRRVRGYTGHELKLVVHGHFHRAQQHWLGAINKFLEDQGVRMIENGAWVGKNEMFAGSAEDVVNMMAQPGPAKWRYRLLSVVDYIPVIRPVVRRMVALGVLIYLVVSASRDRKNGFRNWAKAEAKGSSEHVTIIPAVSKPEVFWLHDPKLRPYADDPEMLVTTLSSQFELPIPVMVSSQVATETSNTKSSRRAKRKRGRRSG